MEPVLSESWEKAGALVWFHVLELGPKQWYWELMWTFKTQSLMGGSRVIEGVPSEGTGRPQSQSGLAM